MTKHHGHVSTPETHPELFRQALQTGRINITLCNFGSKEAVYVCNVYGWANGEKCTIAAGKTNKLFQAARAEFDCLPQHPKILVGDINATVEQLPDMKEMLQEGWTDVGHNASWWGGDADLPTCQAPNNVSSSTRRDYIIARPALLARIAGYHVVWSEVYTVHATLQLLIHLDDEPLKVTRNNVPQSLDVAIRQDIKQRAETNDATNDAEKYEEAKAAVAPDNHHHMDKHLRENHYALHKARSNSN